MRALLELLVDPVVVTDGAVEIRYAIPTGLDDKREPFWGLRTDYRDDHVPVQGDYRSWPARPDAASPEDRDQGRLLGAEPDDQLRYAGSGCLG
jgi:hypothetical protein